MPRKMAELLFHEQQSIIGRIIPKIKSPSGLEGRRLRVLVDDSAEVDCFQIRPLNLSTPAHTFFYLPGTASATLCPEAEKATAANLAAVFHCQVIIILHRFSYQNKYPIPLNDVSIVIHHFLSHYDEYGINPYTVAIGGYSSGGFLTIQLCMLYLQEGEIPFRQVLLIAPITSLSMQTERPYARDGEFFFTKEFFQSLVDNFVSEGQDPESVIFSPVKNPSTAFRDFPPTTIVYGSKECTADDIITFAHLLPQVDLQALEGLDHDFPWNDVSYMEGCVPRIKALFTNASTLAVHDAPRFLLKVVPIPARAAADLTSIVRLSHQSTFGDFKSETNKRIPQVIAIDHCENILALPWHISRQALEDLENLIGSCKNSLVQIAIVGAPGAGKTVLMQNYVEKYRQNLPHRKIVKTIFVLRAENANILLTDYLKFAEQLGVEIGGNKEIGEIRAMVDRALVKRTGFLLVFDNVADYADIYPYIPRRAPSDPPLCGQVIITSRNILLLRSDGIEASLFDLNTHLFSITESTQLLHKVINGVVDHNDSDAEILVNMLGRLPLKIAQAATYIAHQQINYETYIHLLKGSPRDVWAEERRKRVSLVYDHTYEFIVQLLINELTKMGGCVFLLLRICSILSPEDITIKLLRECCRDQTESDIIAAMDKLQSTSLLYPTAKEGLYNMHRITQEAIRANHDKDPQATLLITVTALNARLNQNYRELTNWRERKQGWEIASSSLPNAEAVLAHINNLEPINDQLRLEKIRLLQLMGETYSKMSRAQLAEAKFRAAKEEVETLHLPELSRAHKELFVEVLLSLGRMLIWKKGVFPETMAVLLAGYSLTVELYGEDDPEHTLRMLGTIGACYKLNGYLKEAEFIYRDVITKPLPPNEWQEAGYNMNLAEICISLGNIEEGEKFATTALKVYESHQHPQLYDAYNTLGWSYLAVGALDNACRYFECSASNDERKIFQVVATYGLLKVSLAKNDYDGARQYLKKIEAFEKDLGTSIYDHIRLRDFKDMYDRLEAAPAEVEATGKEEPQTRIDPLPILVRLPPVVSGSQDSIIANRELQVLLTLVQSDLPANNALVTQICSQIPFAGNGQTQVLTSSIYQTTSTPQLAIVEESNLEQYGYPTIFMREISGGIILVEKANGNAVSEIFVPLKKEALIETIEHHSVSAANITVQRLFTFLEAEKGARIAQASHVLKR